MKSLCLLLLVALSMSGCGSQQTRQERAYRKYIKQAKVARYKREKQLLKHQRADLPPLRNPPPPPEQQTAQQPLEPAPDTQ